MNENLKQALMIPLLIAIAVLALVGGWALDTYVHNNQSINRFCESKNLSVIDHNSLQSDNLKVKCSNNIIYQYIDCEYTRKCIEYDEFKDCSKRIREFSCYGEILE